MAFLAWAVSAFALLLGGAADLTRGRDAALLARSRFTPQDVRSGGAQMALDVAAGRFARGAGRLRHPVLAPFRVVPVLGRQLRSAAALSAAAEQVSGAAARATAAVSPALNSSQGSGATRVEVVERVTAAGEEALEALATVDLGPDAGLLPPLREAHDELAVEVAEARAAGERLVRTTAGLGEFLRGPRRYLLLAANNAEMRAGSGMFLSAGVLTIVDGEFVLGEVEPTGDLTLDGAGLDVPGDQGTLWGWANPGREWRNLAMTPQFPATAELASRLWVARGGEPVDGVLAMDVRALSGLLAATGPVEVDDRRIGADDVEQLLLHDQYEGLTFDEDRRDLQEVRRDRLGEIARITVAALQSGDVDLPILAERVADAGAGRHLLLWGTSRVEQDAWSAAGVDGTVGPDQLLLSVLNRGGNKLDPFLDVDAEVRSTPRGDDHVRVEVAVRLGNRTPDAEPVYVAGPRPDFPDVPAGAYVGLVALTMPAAADELAVGDPHLRQVAGRDGPSQVMATNVVLERGAAERIVFSFRVPVAAARSITVAPSARVPASSWRTPGDQWVDESPHLLDLRP